MLKDQLPPYVYYQSYLEKAGVRLNLNVVDTYCKKGFSFSFILVFILFCFLQFARFDGSLSDAPRFMIYYHVLNTLCLVYLFIYIIRYIYFLFQRQSLKKKRSPLALEAYAIVILDGNGNRFKKSKYFCRSAIVYKECGTLKPRFFTGQIKNGFVKNFVPEQMALLYMHYKNKKIFTIDEEHAAQTVSAKRQAFKKFNFNQISKENAVDSQGSQN